MIRIYYLFCFSIPIVLCPIGLMADEDTDTLTGTIEITTINVKPEQGGNMLFLLSNSKDTWLKTNTAFMKKTVPADKDTISVVFDNVPYDSNYAVQVIHDKNENEKFDFRWFPFPRPKEGAGVSNNNFRMGPPEYDKARFKVDKSTTSITIEMRY